MTAVLCGGGGDWVQRWMECQRSRICCRGRGGGGLRLRWSLETCLHDKTRAGHAYGTPVNGDVVLFVRRALPSPIGFVQCHNFRCSGFACLPRAHSMINSNFLNIYMA